MNQPIPESESDRFRQRLCHTLVVDWLVDMEAELLELRSGMVLNRHPWAGGKRLRPITFLLSYLSARVEQGHSTRERGREVQLAAALELLHEASLVHDDLVDRSTLRRGQPTVQMTSGAARALLMGDYMAFRALKLVLDCAVDAQDIALARELADTGLEIAHGQLQQAEQILNPSTPDERMSLEVYVEIIGKKTALFFAGCAEGGAALARSTPELRRSCFEFGLHLGLVFQMLDDLIDVIGDPDIAAKSLANNLAEGTVTLPFIQAWRLQPELPGLARLARAQPLSAADQRDTLAFVASEPVIARCRDVIATHVERALSAWQQLPHNIYSMGLHDLLGYVCACSWGGMPSLLDGLDGAERAGGTP